MEAPGERNMGIVGGWCFPNKETKKKKKRIKPLMRNVLARAEPRAEIPGSSVFLSRLRVRVRVRVQLQVQVQVKSPGPSSTPSPIPKCRQITSPNQSWYKPRVYLQLQSSANFCTQSKLLCRVDRCLCSGTCVIKSRVMRCGAV